MVQRSRGHRSTSGIRSSGDSAKDEIERGPASQAYALGYSDIEFQRLESQGSLIRGLTEDVLRRAGLQAGMRVLDLGSGAGDVSLLAAELVGPSGRVLGVDRSADAAAVAQRRAAAAGFDHVRFVAADLDTFASDETFDALIGRLVLMYLPQPAATLRRLCGYLHPGAVVAFQELTMPLARSIPEGPQFRQCRDWIVRTFERAGFELDMGGKLFATFVAAGLPAPELGVAGIAGGGAQSPVYAYVAGTLRSLLPMTERLGVATAADIEIDTLADRLRNEAAELSACIMPPPFISAWTRMPGR